MTEQRDNSGSPAYLYWSTVRHQRLGQVRHRLQYRVYSLLVDIDRLDDPTLPGGFSHNRFNLFSLFDRDHGGKSTDQTAAPLRDWVEQTLRVAGADFHPASIRLFCFPRVLGFVFNPLSVWFIADGEGQPRATLYEVRNTFGEWHNYLFWSRGRLPARQAVAKRFYVSPLLDMTGGYQFLCDHPPLHPEQSDRLTVAINRQDSAGPILHASQSGYPERLTAGAIRRALVLRPLMTLKVVLGIHFEALRLFIKGASFYHRPPKPEAETTACELPGVADRQQQPGWNHEPNRPSAARS